VTQAVDATQQAARADALAPRPRLPLWTITGSESKCLPVRLPVAVG